MRIDYASNYRIAERDTIHEPTDGLLRLLTTLDLAHGAPVPTAALLSATGLQYSDLALTLAVLESVDAVEVEREADGTPVTSVKLIASAVANGRPPVDV